MATMKAKHAFGMLENIDQALSNGAIDSYDILFVKDVNGKPYVGWIDKDGNKVICDDSAEFDALLKQIATKANASEVEALETELATKVNAEDVDAKVASANAYTDKMVEAAMGEHLTKKYEVINVPEGTLVDYRDGEIRVLCPSNSQWVKQSVGEGGDPNCYYATFRTYVPNDSVVGYKEYMGSQADSEILTKLSTDEYGRKYQTTWIALARCNETTGVWSYYGANSSESKYIGWDYRIEWFDADNTMIASDSVRINLSNENCHFEIKPYYVGGMMTEIETMINEKVAEVNSAYEIVEF